MKKFLSIVMLVCIMASMCSVNAWADDSIGVSKIDSIGAGAGLTDEGNYREKFGFDISPLVDGGKTSASNLVVELYSGTTRLSATKRIDPSITTYKTTVNIVLYGQASGSWQTEWYEPLSETVYPTSVQINYINESGEIKTFVNSWGLSTDPARNSYSSFLAPKMPFAVRTKGVVTGYYNSIDEAMNAAVDGSEVFIRQTGEHVLPNGGGRNITFIGSVSGVVVNMQNKDNNYGSQTNFINIDVIKQPVPVVPPAPGGTGGNTGTVPVAPVVENVYYIPATDDNSNMALWSILALALLTTAFVTRKRKSEN